MSGFFVAPSVLTTVISLPKLWRPQFKFPQINVYTMEKTGSGIALVHRKKAPSIPIMLSLKLLK
jgi:hypothetical protein